MAAVLDRDFFLRDTISVARGLLGKVLVSTIHGSHTAGLIIETEAYDGESDLACHARSGRTQRNAVMYAAGGHAYVYFTYGMHWMFNCVVGPEEYPAAVLIRAVFPTEGLHIIRTIRSPIPEKHWCDGPAKLTKSFGITGSHNGLDLCMPGAPIFIENGNTIPPEDIHVTPRIGIENTPEPWKSKPWRFTINLA